MDQQASQTNESESEPKAERAERATMAFTDLSLVRLNPGKRLAERLADINRKRRQAGLPKQGLLLQMYIWDSGSDAPLGLLIGAGGAKTFRTTFKWEGKWVWQTLGRYPDMTLADARALASATKAKAGKGVDPRLGEEQASLSAGTYGALVDQFIERYAKPRQRTWDQTQRILKSCKPWLDRPIAEITKHDANKILNGFRDKGRDYAAAVTLTWWKTLWKWAWKNDYVDTPMMDAVDYHFKKRERDRVYSDDEIKALWKAANGLDAEAGAFVKLLVLLAPRKTALGLVRWSDLDSAETPTLWTTPFELTKSTGTASTKKKYLTPLPALAQRVLKGLPRQAERVFPSLPLRGGRRDLDTHTLERKLIALGAPEDFTCHALRHTLATWLQTAGHSEWEIGLILNHAGSGSVTAGYSHGYPLELKQQLLSKWAGHVERLVQPHGAALLR